MRLRQFLLFQLLLLIIVVLALVLNLARRLADDSFVTPTTGARTNVTVKVGNLSLRGDPSLNPSSCTPATKVGFLKTHKTASSTIQSIILRHSLHEELNIILPMNRTHFYEVPLIEQLKEAPWADTIGRYDILCTHTRWHKQEWRSVLGEGALMVSILRDPTDTFESIYQYYRMFEKTGVSLAVFIDEFTRGNKSIFVRGSRPYGLNNMLWSFGVDVDDATAVDDVSLLDKIRELEADFDLVMIAEFMDESLVLLAHLLCWPLHEMVSLEKNVRLRESKVKLSVERRRALQEMQHQDQVLYDHFVSRLVARIEEFGADNMRKSVDELRWLRQQAATTCIAESTGLSFQGLNLDVKDLFVRPDIEECVLMGLTEMFFYHRLRKRQGERLAKADSDLQQ